MRIYNFALVLLCLLSFCFTSNAQVVINEEIEIAKALEYYKTLANSTDHINGWRIQLINTDNRRQMEAAKAKFSSQYPYLKLTWEHVQPYYKVKVGAYKDKMELEAFLRELKSDFPRAIPIRDKIYKSELSL
jgi:hypothetical protein